MKQQIRLFLMLIAAGLLLVQAVAAQAKYMMAQEIASGIITQKGTDGALTLDNAETYSPAMGAAIPELQPGAAITLRYFKKSADGSRHYTEFAPGMHSLQPETFEQEPLREAR